MLTTAPRRTEAAHTNENPERKRPLAVVRLLAAVASGLALAASLPPVNWEWLGWFALAPLIIAMQGLRPLERLGLSLLAGLAAAVFATGGHLADPTAVYALFLFGWFALFLGIIGGLAIEYRRFGTGIPWVAAVTASGVLLEWLLLNTPLPVHLALTQSRNTPLLPLCTFTGIWGVSFLLWWVNVAVVEAAIGRRYEALAVAVLLVIPALTIRNFQDSDRRSSHSWVRVAAVQDAPDAALLSHLRRPASRILSEHPITRGDLTREATANGARIIVWPELCLLDDFHPAADDDPTRILAQSTHALLAVGYLEQAQEVPVGKPYDSAALIDTDGRVLGVHRKIHPFLGERSEIRRGTNARAIPTALGPVGVEICFDTCFPDVTRSLANQGAVLICMPTMDPPAVNGVVHYLHSTMLPFRAAESGVPFVRADPYGLSEVVAGDGAILDELPLGVRAELTRNVSLGHGTGTFYSHWGDWFVVFCMITLGGALWTALLRQHVPTTPSRSV